MGRKRTCWFILCHRIPENQKEFFAFEQIRAAQYYYDHSYTVLTNFFDCGLIRGLNTEWADYCSIFQPSYHWPYLQKGDVVVALYLKKDPEHQAALRVLRQYCKELESPFKAIGL